MNKLTHQFFAFCLFAFSPLFIEAIMQNHYILGTNGINSAVKPVKGFVYTNMYFHYHAPHLVNSDGKNISLDSDIIMKTDLNIFPFLLVLLYLVERMDVKSLHLLLI